MVTIKCNKSAKMKCENKILYTKLESPKLLEHLETNEIRGLAVTDQATTALAWVEVQARSSGTSGGLIGNEAGFLLVLRFPLPSIPSTAPHLSSSSGAGTIGHLVAAVIGLVQLLWQ
jgi:hypothetical protein